MQPPVNFRARSAPPARSITLKSFASVLAGVLLLQFGWAMALPIFRGADEIEHVKKVSGVSSGTFLSSSVPVEIGIVQAQRQACLLLHDGLDSEVCEPVRTTSAAENDPPSTALMQTTAALANPAWYLAVAPAVWALDGVAAVWGIKAITLVICALMITWAISISRGRALDRYSQSGLMLCLTPAVIYASVVAAPNGVHFSAALLLWVALLRADDHHQHAWAICVAGATLSVTHTLGLFWLVCALATVALLHGRGYMERLWRNVTRSRVAFSLLAIAISFTIAWIATVRPNDPTRSGGDVLAESTKEIPAAAHGFVWVIQLVGTMPYRFDFLWFAVYALWMTAFALFLIRAVAEAGPRERLTMGAITVVSVAIPVAVTIWTYDVHGYAWQGRYELPLLFALPLIAGTVRHAPGHRDRMWTAVQLVSTGAATALAPMCLALRTDSSGAVAGGAALLAMIGWWIIWRPSRSSTHREDSGTVTP